MSWTDELKRATGIDFETTAPSEIEKRSFERIGEELGETFLRGYPREQLPVLMRVIHTTADFSYAEQLVFLNGAMEAAIDAVKNQIPIVTDTTMAASGINKSAAERLGVSVHCLIGDEAVREQAAAEGITRSAAAVDKAAMLYPDCIYAVGNAPTALMRLFERIESGAIRPRLVIGVPVGFVNVVQAKELIARTQVPCIVAHGRKGGSNVAAAICNAILYMAGGRDALSTAPSPQKP